MPTVSPRLAFGLALSMIGVVFLGTFDNGFVNWDDHLYLAHNPLVTAPQSQSLWARWTTPTLGYPLPLPVWIYGWLWRVGGGAAWPFHALSWVVHLLNAALVYRLLRQCGAAPGPARLGMVAFAVHPIVVEPVAWASGLKDLLATLGSLVAIAALLRGRSPAPGSLLAWASKPSSVALGLILVLFAWVPRRPSDRPTPTRARRIECVLLAVVGFGVGAFAWAQEEPSLRTTADVPWSVSRILSALGLQVEHLLIPAKLAPAVTPSEATVVHRFVAAILIGITVALWIRWLRRDDPRAPWLGLSLLAYAPVSNLVPLFRFTADSYAYLPWAGMVATATLSARDITDALARLGPRIRTFVRNVPYVVLFAWMVMSAARVEVWRDTLSLWGEAWEDRSDDPEFLYRYGDALGRADRRREELALYLSALDRVAMASRLPPALPLYFEGLGHPERALAWYRLAFDRPLAQDDAMYWHYVDFVVRHPEIHHPSLESALRYALAHLPPDRSAALSETDRETLQRVLARRGPGVADEGPVTAEQLGLPPGSRLGP